MTIVSAFFHGFLVMVLYDTIIKNVFVVRPKAFDVPLMDIGIKNGRFAAIERGLNPALAEVVVDGKGNLAFPGVIDAHTHVGIYAPLSEDALSESRAAVQGGVTCMLNYIRTGKYYLNKGGSYRDFMPEVLSLSDGNYFCDYGYHIAPMSAEHIDELGLLLKDFGVSSFKIFMFYGCHGLHGSAADQHDFLMIPSDQYYDVAHFEMVMRGVQELALRYPQFKDAISLSLHCETGEIMRAYTKLVLQNTSLTGLRAYSASRPPHSEGLAIFTAAYLANTTDCLNINLLHLSSAEAVYAAMLMQGIFPQINFRREVTIGHLLLDYDAPQGALAKVNPPIRSRKDVETLWKSLIDGQIDWVVSDHACCAMEQKVAANNPDDIFLAKSGFGGTEYLLPGLISEGTKRGLTVERIAELLCYTPAKRYGVANKGDIAVGLDADLALVDPERSMVVDSKTSESAQGYSPFEGMELSATVMKTFVRGQLVYENGKVIGQPQGAYVFRPQQSEIVP
jgi:allantoinase